MKENEGQEIDITQCESGGFKTGSPGTKNRFSLTLIDL
jgi:hypothetical protein